MSQDIQYSSLVEPFQNSEYVKCNICLELVEEEKKVSLACNHIFHGECIECWLKLKLNCPCCRSDVWLGVIRSEDGKVHVCQSVEACFSGDPRAPIEQRRPLRLEREPV